MASGAQRRSELLRGVLDLCLLAVIEEGPAYGYEMTKRLRARGLSIVGEGSIYPLLGRLEREGLVETHRAASTGIAGRLQFRIVGLDGTERWVDSHMVPYCPVCGRATRQLDDVCEALIPNVVRNRISLVLLPSNDTLDNIGNKVCEASLLKHVTIVLSAKKEGSKPATQPDHQPKVPPNA